MQWKRVLLYCTFEFLHCDWFLLLMLTAGYFGVMDKWRTPMQEVVGSSPAPFHNFLVALKESYIGSIEYEDSLEL